MPWSWSGIVYARCCNLCAVLERERDHLSLLQVFFGICRIAVVGFISLIPLVLAMSSLSTPYWTLDKCPHVELSNNAKAVDSATQYLVKASMLVSTGSDNKSRNYYHLERVNIVASLSIDISIVVDASSQSQSGNANRGYIYEVSEGLWFWLMRSVMGDRQGRLNIPGHR